MHINFIYEEYEIHFMIHVHFLISVFCFLFLAFSSHGFAWSSKSSSKNSSNSNNNNKNTHTESPTFQFLFELYSMNICQFVMSEILVLADNVNESHHTQPSKCIDLRLPQHFWIINQSICVAEKLILSAIKVNSVRWQNGLFEEIDLMKLLFRWQLHYYWYFQMNWYGNNVALNTICWMDELACRIFSIFILFTKWSCDTASYVQVQVGSSDSATLFVISS